MVVKYDIIIIGGGPAGLTAALYAKRANWRVLVIEKMIAGGQMNLATTIENYPGVGAISGADLADKMYTQVQNLGVEFVFNNIESVNLPDKTVRTPDATYQARALIIATGAGPRKTQAVGEARFLDNGVHYCALCDGGFYRDQPVVMVGGGKAALEDALYLASVCQTVTIIDPSPAFNAPENLVAAVAAQSNINHIYHESAVAEILGQDKVSGVKVKNLRTGATQDLACAGVFVALGRMPNVDLFYPDLALGKGSYVKTDENCATNLPGVYAVGDVREKSCRQVVTAVADGAIAATAAGQYLKQLGAQA